MTSSLALASAIDSVVAVLVAYYGFPPALRRLAKQCILLVVRNFPIKSDPSAVKCLQETRKVIYNGSDLRPTLLPLGYRLKEIGVVLTEQDEALALQHATCQHEKALRLRCRDSLGNVQEREPDLVGARGELAFARALNLFWQRDTEGWKGNDVSGYQVRTSTRSTGSLIIRDRDRKDDVYVLVTGSNDKYIVRGWMYGHEAPKVGWYGARGKSAKPAYWIKQESLNNISSLPDLRDFSTALPFSTNDDEEF